MPSLERPMEHLGVLIPIFALSIPVVAIFMSSLRKIAETRLEETRIKASAGGGGVEAAALREEMDDLRRELGEVQERLDFTERMLMQVRDNQQLPPRA
jgi:Tfp pilus assembly protein PilO